VAEVRDGGGEPDKRGPIHLGREVERREDADNGVPVPVDEDARVAGQVVDAEPVGGRVAVWP
jgi:hypothetical protein